MTIRFSLPEPSFHPNRSPLTTNKNSSLTKLLVNDYVERKPCTESVGKAKVLKAIYGYPHQNSRTARPLTFGKAIELLTFYIASPKPASSFYPTGFLTHPCLVTRLHIFLFYPVLFLFYGGEGCKHVPVTPVTLLKDHTT